MMSCRYRTIPFDISNDSYKTSSGYQNLVVVGAIPINVSGRLRFFSSAGSPDTGVKYRYAARSFRDNGDHTNAVSGVGGDGTIVTMGNYNGTDADDLLQGQFILHNPAGTGGRKQVHGSSVGMQTDTATFYSYFSANYAETSNAVTGVRFFFNSGNIEKGIFKLYGIN